MALNALISISQQTAAIAEVLRLWAQPKGGVVAVMANQSHLWENLYIVSDAPRVLVMFSSATLRFPEEPDCRREDRVFQVIVVRGHGFKDPLSGGSREPFTDSLEQVRDKVRAMLNISDEEEFPSLRYRSIRPLPNVMPTKEANAFADAMLLEFSTANDLPKLLEELPGTEGTEGDELPPDQ